MTAPTPVFHQHKVLQNHTDSINAIAFSLDGEYMASGGDDKCVVIFTTRSWKVLKTYGMDTAIRAIAWHPTIPARYLSLGTEDGVVTTVELKTDKSSELYVDGSLHCLAIEKEGKFIAVGSSNKVVVARKSSPSTWSPPSLVSEEVHDIALSVHFRNKQLVIVTYLRAGIIAFNISSPSSVTEQWRVNPKVNGLCGGSALSPNSHFLATSVLFGGIQWHDLSTRQLTFHTEQPLEIDNDITLPVAFIGNRTIVVGSQVGRVCVFSHGKAEATQILEHPSDEIVQALGYHHNDRRRVHFLATGISGAYDDCSITIWAAYDKRRFKVALALAIVLAGMIIVQNDALLSGWRKIEMPLWGNIHLRNGTFERVIETPDRALEDHTHVVTKTVEVVVDSRQSIVPTVPPVHTHVVTKTVEVVEEATQKISKTQRRDRRLRTL
ncbi:WD40-repeat-containing domain protein [Mycena galericulata]|nr:WD40-repeat-containing domain protein [Mycena galericulata]